MPRDKVLFVSPGGEVFGSFLSAQKGTKKALKTRSQVQDDRVNYISYK
jgi:hypothetical protein